MRLEGGDAERSVRRAGPLCRPSRRAEGRPDPAGDAGILAGDARRSRAAPPDGALTRLGLAHAARPALRLPVRRPAPAACPGAAARVAPAALAAGRADLRARRRLAGAVRGHRGGASGGRRPRRRRHPCAARLPRRGDAAHRRRGVTPRSRALLAARAAARRPHRRRRRDGARLLPDAGHHRALRHRAGPQPALAHRPGHPLDRRRAGHAAGARPAVPGRRRGRLARPDPDVGRADWSSWCW